MQKTHIPLNVSKQYTRLVSAALIITLVIIPFLTCTILLKLILTIIVMIYGSKLYNQPITALTRDDDGWQIHEKDKIYHAKLCGNSTVTRYLCILRFKVKGKFFKRSCLVFRDSFQFIDDYRKFILILNNYQRE